MNTYQKYEDMVYELSIILNLSHTESREVFWTITSQAIRKSICYSDIMGVIMRECEECNFSTSFNPIDEYILSSDIKSLNLIYKHLIKNNNAQDIYRFICWLNCYKTTIIPIIDEALECIIYRHNLNNDEEKSEYKKEFKKFINITNSIIRELKISATVIELINNNEL